jgi:hypothetical protein
MLRVSLLVAAAATASAADLYWVGASNSLASNTMWTGGGELPMAHGVAATETMQCHCREWVSRACVAWVWHTTELGVCGHRCVGLGMAKHFIDHAPVRSLIVTIVRLIC